MRSRSSLRSNSVRDRERDRREQDIDGRHIRHASFNLSNCNDEDTRAVFDLIRGSPEGNVQALTAHLERTQDVIDITALFNADGNTALTFAASENKVSACNCLISFVKRSQDQISQQIRN